MERYPAFRSQSLNVSKHVTLMGELARLTDKNALLDVSKLEQEIACNSDHSTHKADLFEMFDNPKVGSMDKLRLALLYIIRYESQGELPEIKAALNQLRGLPPQRIALIDAIIQYAGEQRRAPGLFGTGVISLLQKTVKSAISGVENVYTQHQPLLSQILDSLAKGKIKDAAFPLAWGTASKPPEVLVFIVGGATYEEATKVAEFNAANPSMRILLGGSCVHNSSSFLGELEEMYTTVVG